jgi:TIR domain
MADGYEHDIFLSYSRRSPVGPWVQNHFYPLLDDWLRMNTPRHPEIFADWRQETGVNWPARLKRALRRSRCMVAVLSPDYFRSPWCMAEWQSMKKREEILGLATEESPLGLVFPIIFADGECFPHDAKVTQYIDLHKWNQPQPQFKKTKDYLKLTQKVQGIAEELARLIDKAPAWEANWPIILPPVDDQPPRLSLPRIK